MDRLRDNDSQQTRQSSVQRDLKVLTGDHEEWPSGRARPADIDRMSPDSPFGPIPDDLWSFDLAGDAPHAADAPSVASPSPSTDTVPPDPALGLLSPTAVSVLEDIARWGPVTDELLARLRVHERRTHARQGSTVRNYVVDLTRAGLVHSHPRFRRGASARVVSPEGEIFLGAGAGRSNPLRSDPLALDRMLSLDVALGVVKSEHRVLCHRDILEAPDHIDALTGKPMTLLMQSTAGEVWHWVPDAVIGAGTELWAVAAHVPGTETAKRRTIERVFAQGHYSRFIVTTRSAPIAMQIRDSLFHAPAAGRVEVKLIFE